MVISYLKITGCELGLLINLNVPVLTKGIRRIIWIINRRQVHSLNGSPALLQQLIGLRPSRGEIARR